MGIDGIRPVELELVELFEQNSQISVTISEATKLLREHGYIHVDKAVRDNLYILTNSGFLIYDKDERRFSINQNTTKDLTKKMLLPSKPKHSDHCDKCGRKFNRGEKPFARSFANIELYLCAECHEPKVVA